MILDFTLLRAQSGHRLCWLPSCFSLGMLAKFSPPSSVQTAQLWPLALMTSTYFSGEHTANARITWWYKVRILSHRFHSQNSKSQKPAALRMYLSPKWVLSCVHPSNAWPRHWLECLIGIGFYPNICIAVLDYDFSWLHMLQTVCKNSISTTSLERAWIYGTGHKNAILELHWTTDGERVITASPDKTVRAWDTKTGEQVKKMTEHDNFVNSCCPLKQGAPLLVSGSDDGSAKVEVLGSSFLDRASYFFMAWENISAWSWQTELIPTREWIHVMTTSICCRGPLPWPALLKPQGLAGLGLATEKICGYNDRAVPSLLCGLFSCWRSG